MTRSPRRQASDPPIRIPPLGKGPVVTGPRPRFAPTRTRRTSGSEHGLISARPVGLLTPSNHTGASKRASRRENRHPTRPGRTTATATLEYKPPDRLSNGDYSCSTSAPCPCNVSVAAAHIKLLRREGAHYGFFITPNVAYTPISAA